MEASLKLLFVVLVHGVIAALGEVLEVDVSRGAVVEELQQILFDLGEGRPLVEVLVPAASHDVVEFGAAVLGTLQPVAFTNLPHHLPRRHAGVRGGGRGGGE